MGYTPNYSHLVGIMISKTIGCRGTLFSDKPIWKRSCRFPKNTWSLQDDNSILMIGPIYQWLTSWHRENLGLHWRMAMPTNLGWTLGNWLLGSYCGDHPFCHWPFCKTVRWIEISNQCQVVSSMESSQIEIAWNSKRILDYIPTLEDGRPLLYIDSHICCKKPQSVDGSLNRLKLLWAQSFVLQQMRRPELRGTGWMECQNEWTGWYPLGIQKELWNLAHWPSLVHL